MWYFFRCSSHISCVWDHIIYHINLHDLLWYHGLYKTGAVTYHSPMPGFATEVFLAHTGAIQIRLLLRLLLFQGLPGEGADHGDIGVNAAGVTVVSPQYLTCRGPSMYWIPPVIAPTYRITSAYTTQYFRQRRQIDCAVGAVMASAEPITGVGGRAPSGGIRGKLKAFCPFSYKREANS